jgi:cytochrome c-type biogenesis protein
MTTAQLDFPLLMVAAGAGLLSFISPCVLPLLPAYLGYITGYSAEQLATQREVSVRTQVLLHSLAFVAGLAIVFTLLGASATLLGRTLLRNLELVSRVGGLLVIIFGLHTLGLVRIPLLYQEKRVNLPLPSKGGLLGALVLGAVFAAGWTPCVGPFLASLLTLASQEQTVGQGMLLLFVYSLGLGTPFVLAGLATERSLAVVGSLKRHLRLVEIVSGALLVLMGLLLFTERLSLLSSWLTRVFGIGLAQ